MVRSASSTANWRSWASARTRWSSSSATTGRGGAITSELEGGGEQSGEKGSTTQGGMHVPLVASWPGTIASGTVCDDLIDLTDFLPTICEAAGVAVPESIPQDGRSFLPQLRGERGNPRDWIYSFWVPLRENQMAHVGSRGAVEQAFDHRYKLYSTGEFFHFEQDPEEQSPIPLDELAGEAAEAARTLQGALDHFKDARPADLPAPDSAKQGGKAQGCATAMTAAR